MLVSADGLRDASELVPVMYEVCGQVSERRVDVHPESHRVMENSG